jgi:hypothetical protein
MELTFLLDGTQYEDPIDWSGLNEVTRWDFSFLMYIRTFDGGLTFKGDAYNYLYNKFLAGDLCSLIRCEAYFNSTKVIDGNIFLTDCEFNETSRVVTTKVQDAGYGARIQNNRGIDVACDQTTTKNGEAITPATVALTLCFDPADGTGLSEWVPCYFVRDVFEYLVTWMSDGLVAFKSDYFSSGDGQVWRMTSGFNLRNLGSSPMAPKVSFSDLYDCFRKLLRISMGFDVAPDGRPRLRIEPESFFRDTGTSVTIENTTEVTLSFVQDVLYASARVGTTITRVQDCDNGDADCSAAVNVNYYGCDNEQYGIAGTCNSDSELNLMPLNKFIYDTNTIQDIAVYGNEQYDDDVVLIETAGGAAFAADTDPLGIGQHWYNGSIMNNEVLTRWQDYLLGSMSFYGLQSGVGNFKADDFTTAVLLPLQTPAFTDVTIDPTNVVYNPQNAWSNITNRWTAAYDGVYSFTVSSAVVSFGASPVGIAISTQLNVDHYDSGGTLINRYSGPVEGYVTGDPFEAYTYTTPYISIEAGEYCIYTISYAQSIPPAINQAQIVYGVESFGPTVNNGYFTLNDSRAAVGGIQVNTGASLTYVKRSFERGISDEPYFTIRNNPFSKVSISNSDGTRSGWLGMIKRNFVTEQCEVEILTTA